MKTLFKGGAVVSGQGVRDLDVLVEGEAVSALAPDLDCPGAQVVDCTGRLLFPGFIDAHTHFDLEVGGTITADDFRTGTRAALRGGTTTVIDFAAPNKGETLASGLARWQAKAEGAACDYGFHMTIDDWNEGISREIGEMAALGIPTFKLYMTYPAMMLRSGEMLGALRRLKELGCLAGVHCENSALIDVLTAEAREAGRLGPASHPRVRPAVLEAEAVSRLLRMARLADVPVMVVHLTCREALEEVRAARRRGQTVYAETCPHYLLLDQGAYDHPDFLEAAKYVCAPPLREKADQEALWEALRTGEIQTVATDHCSFTLAQKRAGRYDFTKIPGGLPGVEHRGALLYTCGVAAGRLAAADMYRALCENPAKLYGCWPRKGVIAPGSDGDIVIFDPKARWTITAQEQVQNVDYTPYEGWEIQGRVERVYLRGVPAVEAGRVLETRGRFLPRGLPEAVPLFCN